LSQAGNEKNEVEKKKKILEKDLKEANSHLQTTKDSLAN
jgi:hypothetical protein